MIDISHLEFQHPADARACMKRIGVSAAGCRLMEEKAISLPVMMRGMTCPEANIIKQEMLICGGDAAIHREVITGRVESADVLLLGSRKQIRKVAASLQEQAFRLPEAGQQLEALLKGSRKGLRCGAYELDLQSGMQVMGIVNVTPDSFSDGGQFADGDTAAAHGRRLAEAGADLIDIGGESTRPGAAEVPADEEIKRVVPVIEALQDLNVPLSIDTRKPETVRAALAAGAVMVNDVSGFEDAAMIAAAAEYNAGIVIMHMQGTPEQMQDDPRYENVVDDILAFFEERITAALEGGVSPDSIVIDPGIGFGKTAAHNQEILRRVSEFGTLGFPVLIGASRKSFIKAALGLEVDERLPADLAVASWCLRAGVAMIRVHDVREAVIVRDMLAFIRKVDE